MKTSTLKIAIAEAKRFIALANQVGIYKTYSGETLPDTCETGKYAAAAKRASLDLTRALAEMRKP